MRLVLLPRTSMYSNLDLSTIRALSIMERSVGQSCADKWCAIPLCSPFLNQYTFFFSVSVSSGAYLISSW
ncbi:hypothetical protein PL81_17310 [Streptomyces sp. RSD-27]|nr:hypothetical protein PL81_17310 [Streptomyces sp. RSD-27]